MSRSLGRKARVKELKRNHAGKDPESQGWQAFKAGQPKTSCPYYGSGSDYGKAYAWQRGWTRAQTEARKLK